MTTTDDGDPKRIALAGVLHAAWPKGEPVKCEDDDCTLYDLADAALEAGYRRQVTVYRLAWHGEPAMGGGFHTASSSREFASLPEALDAARAARVDRRPGFRVERRGVTAWEAATC